MSDSLIKVMCTAWSEQEERLTGVGVKDRGVLAVVLRGGLSFVVILMRVEHEGWIVNVIMYLITEFL